MAVALLNPYCSLGELCHELNRDAPVAGDEQDELHEAINNASRMVDSYKGRDYYQHDYSSTPLLLDQFGGWFVGDTLFLPYAPIISLTAVSLAGAAWVSNVDYFTDFQGNRIVRLSGTGWDEVKRPDSLLSITGKFGYAQATSADVPVGMPGNIKLAARLIAAALSGQNRKEMIGLDGSKMEFIDRVIPKTAYEALGSRAILI
jgi:hypothetical protein